MGDIESLQGFDFPNWILAVIILVWVLKDSIGKIALKVPVLANAHFSYKAKTKEVDEKFERDKEYKLLEDRLEASESAREQQKEREQQYFKIINEAMHFSQTVLLTKMDENHATILIELKNLQRSVERLNRTVTGKNTSQNMILERLEKKE